MSLNTFAPLMVAPVLIALAMVANVASAGEADVRDVNVQLSADGTYRFDVTVQHADTGWDHYADAFDVLSPGGEVLSTRVLLHPHEAEQPFTRSLSGVNIPQDVKAVDVRAHDKVHGVGGKVVRVGLPGR